MYPLDDVNKGLPRLDPVGRYSYVIDESSIIMLEVTSAGVSHALKIKQTILID